MPRPVEGTSSYVPGLDGMRAVAVLAVIAFHLNFSWAQGGLLGVGVFFVLSGYLITDLLVAEYRRRGRVALPQFWLRRARRLLPALFVMLFVVTGWVTLFDRAQIAALRSDLVPAHLLLQQLVVHLPARLVLRRLRPAVPVRSPVVVGHRGAVLSGLAVPAARRPQVDPGPAGAHRSSSSPPRRRRRRRCRCCTPPAPTPPASTTAPTPAPSPSHRCRPRLPPAPGPRLRPDHHRCPSGARRRWRRGAGRHLRHVLADQRVRPLLLPGGAGAAVVADRPGHGGGGPPRCPARLWARPGAVAVDRGALLRHLPLALPGHRPDDAPRCRPATWCGRPSRSGPASVSPHSPGSTSSSRCATVP